MYKKTYVFQDINQDIISNEIMNDDNVSREDTKRR